MAERRGGAAYPDDWGGGLHEAETRIVECTPPAWQFGVARADLAEVEQTNDWREDQRSTGQPHGFIVVQRSTATVSASPRLSGATQGASKRQRAAVGNRRWGIEVSTLPQRFAGVAGQVAATLGQREHGLA